jgi:WD40 repeat protein
VTLHHRSYSLWQWDPKTSKKPVLHALPNLNSAERAVFSPSGRVIAVIRYDTTQALSSHLWDVETGKWLQSIPEHKGWRYDLAFDQNCGLRLTASNGPIWIDPDSPAGAILAVHDCSCEHHVHKADQGWSLKRRMILQNGQPSVLLPSDLLVFKCQLSYGATLFMGTDTGHVLRVSDENSEEQDISTAVTDSKIP